MKFKIKFKSIPLFMYFATVLVCFGLSGCSSAKTKKDCEEINYYALGLADGKAGLNSDHLNQAASECSKLGVEAAIPQYGYGRQEGLKEYCSESHARDDAKAGKSGSICWQEPFPAYQTAYREALEKRQNAKQDDLKASREKSDQLNTELQQIENQKAAH